MYKVYNNSLLHVLTYHCHSICINSSKLAPPSLADDVPLIALHPSFLTTFMTICHEYGLTWRYEFNHSKSSIVTYDETKAVHHASMNEREWRLGDDIVEELHEYKDLGDFESAGVGILQKLLLFFLEMLKLLGTQFNVVHRGCVDIFWNSAMHSGRGN